MHYDEKLWFYGCTNIDLIHLTKGSTQRKMLKEFDYVAESDIIFDMEQESQLSMISGENFTYHAVIKKNISSEIELQIYPSNICIVCMMHNMLQCEEKENIAKKQDFHFEMEILFFCVIGNEMRFLDFSGNLV